MDAWQERVIEEKNELDEKIRKLSAFLQSANVNLLNSTDRRLLTEQHVFMRYYSYILGERISLFEGDVL